MSKRDKFLESCRKQKLDTVRWSLGAGGQSPTTRDEDGYTAIMICAAGNLHKALRMLVDHCRKTREREQMDLADGAGDGRTALMMAANNGHKEACQELLDAGCNFKLKCERGMTAADYAAKKGFHELAARINRGGESSEEDTDDEDDAYDSDAPEGETATQRSKRKKRELEAKERRGATDTAAAAAAAAPPPPKPPKPPPPPPPLPAPNPSGPRSRRPSTAISRSSLSRRPSPRPRRRRGGSRAVVGGVGE